MQAREQREYRMKKNEESSEKWTPLRIPTYANSLPEGEREKEAGKNT